MYKVSNHTLNNIIFFISKKKKLYSTRSEFLKATYCLFLVAFEEHKSFFSIYFCYTHCFFFVVACFQLYFYTTRTHIHETCEAVWVNKLLFNLTLCALLKRKNKHHNHQPPFYTLGLRQSFAFSNVYVSLKLWKTKNTCVGGVNAMLNPGNYTGIFMHIKWNCFIIESFSFSFVYFYFCCGQTKT